MIDVTWTLSIDDAKTVWHAIDRARNPRHELVDESRLRLLHIALDNLIILAEYPGTVPTNTRFT